ncbi:hypothetical protein ES703_04954 [subsurface metagenome]
MENKRGLSAIVATLIIILLVLVAVGIIWVVVRNLIQEGAEQIDVSTKCIAVDVRAVSVAPVVGSPESYSVTLRRLSGGETIGGIKIALFNETANSGVLGKFNASATLLGQLDTKTETVAAGITNANRLEYTVYFIDASGNERLCSQTNSYIF